MAEPTTALASAGLVLVLAAGAGSVSCAGARSWPTGRRWVLRVLAGMGVLPLVLVAGHELIGAAARPWTAVAVGVVGLVLAAGQEWRWRGDTAATPPGERTQLVLLLVVAVGLLFTALDGLLGQPGFGGLDPWGHGLGAAYVADAGSLRQPDPGFPLIHYVDAYPPLYDVLLAVPAGLLGDLPAAVKGVAALLVALAPLAVWLLALQLFDDGRTATLAVVIYAVLPSAVPRHPWGHSLAVVLGLVALTAVVALRWGRRWMPAAALALGGALLAAPSQGLKLGLLATAATAAALVCELRWGARAVAAGVGAVLVAGVWLLPAAARAGWDPGQLVRDMQPPELRRADDPVAALPPEAAAPLPWAPKPHDRVGPADVILLRPYQWVDDHTGARRFNPILPAGVGLPVLVLMAAGIAGLHRGRDRPAALLVTCWLIIAAVLTVGAPLGVRLFPWRSWLLVAPAVALVGAVGAVHLLDGRAGWQVATATLAGTQAAVALGWDLGHGLLRSQATEPAWLVTVGAAAAATVVAIRGPAPARWLVVTVVGCHMLVTAPVRAAALLDPVPPRVFYDHAEHHGYLKLAASLPRGTRVWPLSGGMRFEVVTGLGLTCTPWRSAELAMARRATNGHLPGADELVEWLRLQSYRVVVLDPSCGELQAARGAPEAAGTLRNALASHPDLVRLDNVGGDGGQGGSIAAWHVRTAAPPSELGLAEPAAATRRPTGTRLQSSSGRR